MTISAFPAFKNQNKNPYQFLLYSEIIKAGHIIDEFTASNIIKKRYNIIHIHWPESNKFRRSILTAVGYILIFNLLLIIAKIKGAKIIWTIHNLESHEKRMPRLESIHLSIFTRLVDGLIVMNDKTIIHATKKYSKLKGKPFAMIPHGHYKSFYKNTISKEEARKHFRLDSSDKIFLFIGQIRPYKGVESLIQSFKDLKDIHYKLIIAGSTSSEFSIFNSQIKESIINDERIFFKEGYISDSLLQYYFNASDLVVLPYHNILNSGSLILSLSFNKPVLVPNHESLQNFVNSYGNYWVRTFNTLNDTVLSKSIDEDNNLQKTELKMDDRDWGLLGHKTFEFYSKVLNLT